MMPIFFHIQSHLWIAYLFFLNGFLIHLLIRGYSETYSKLTKPFEAVVLAAFFISISFNALLLLGLDTLGAGFASTSVIVPVASTCLVLLVSWRLSKSGFASVETAPISLPGIFLYFFIFVALFYNGALIEQVSDAWWHMSLANKIAVAGAFDIQQGHLHGLPSRYYPPLWHGNLAMASLMSGESIQILWNSFTAWGGVLKTMAYYLLAFALSRDRLIALLSAALFVLLPGIGDSYLRVSAWPSHIAYIAWFALFYAFFTVLDSRQSSAGPVGILLDLVRSRFAGFIAMAVLLVIIFFTHQVELLWFALAILFYFLGLIVHQSVSAAAPGTIEPAFDSLKPVGALLFTGAIAGSIWFLLKRSGAGVLAADDWLVYALPIVCLSIFAVLLISATAKRIPLSRSLAVGLLACLSLLLIFSIDGRHLLSLFSPEMAYPRARYHELPLVATGWFGGSLNIPGWHLQLRSGLLYSGVASVPLALYLAYVSASRATIFVAATGLLSLLFCLSPYLHHWLRDILSYHSPWRISLMVFHPIAFALAITWLWRGNGMLATGKT